MQLVFFDQFANSTTTFYLRSGEFYKDYFLIKHKPKLKSLLIDDLNGVVVINEKNEKRILLKGFHIIHPKEQILHVMNFDFQHFYQGPKEKRNPFSSSNSESDKNNNQFDLEHYSQASSKLNGGLKVVPLFSIYINFTYNNDLEQTKRFLLDLSNYFSIHNISGDLHNHIQYFVGESVSRLWNLLIDENYGKEPSSHSENWPLFADEIIRRTNIFLNEYSSEEVSDSSISQTLISSETINFLKKWDLLTIKVFLKNLLVG